MFCLPRFTPWLLASLAVCLLLTPPAMAQRVKKPSSFALTISLSSASIEVGGTLLGKVTHNNIGWTADVNVQLTSSVTGAVIEPATVIVIPGGATEARFTVSAQAVSPSVSVTATSTGYSSGSAALTITAASSSVIYKTIWLDSPTGVWLDLPPYSLTGNGGSSPYTVSDKGDVVGRNYGLDGLSYAVLFNGTPQTLNGLAADWTWLEAVDNNSMKIVAPNSWRLASGRGINGKGQIAGMAVPAGAVNDDIIRSFRFDPIASEVRILPSNGATWSRTGHYNAINEEGDIVYNDQTNRIVFIYTGDNHLVPVLDAAWGAAIADRYCPSDGLCQPFGDIAGRMDIGGSFHYTDIGLDTERLDKDALVGTKVSNMSSNGTYVVGNKAASTRKGLPTAFRYSSQGMVPLPGYDCWAVNNSGDAATLHEGDGLNRVNLYMDDADTIDLTAQLGYSTQVTSLTERDGTGFPWMCGVAYVFGETRSVLIYPNLR